MMNEYNNKKLTDINDVVRFLKQSPQNPYYDFDTDYTTNSPNYYDYLSKLKPLIQILAERIYDYDEILDLKLEEIEEVLKQVINKIGEGFNEEIEQLLREWVLDGTLDFIINETLMNLKADITYVDEEIDKVSLLTNNLIVQLENKMNERIDLIEKLGDISYNVLSYGAKGDGVTDDYESIQNAINEQKNIYLPEGTYLVTKGLRIPSNRKIYGAGIDKTVIKYDDTAPTGDCLIYNDDIQSGNTNIHLSDFTLDGNKARNGDSPSATGGSRDSNLTIRASNNVHISNIKSINAGLHGFDVTCGGLDYPYLGDNTKAPNPSSFVYIYNCEASNFGDDGFTTHHSEFISITDCYSHSPTNRGNQNGFEVDDGSRHITLTNNTSEGCYGGIEVKAHSGAPAPYNISINGHRSVKDVRSYNFRHIGFHSDTDPDSKTARNIICTNLVSINPNNQKGFQNEAKPRVLAISAYYGVVINGLSGYTDRPDLFVDQPLITCQFKSRNITLNGILLNGFDKASQSIYVIGGKRKASNINISNVTLLNSGVDGIGLGGSVENVSITNVNAVKERSNTGFVVRSTNSQLDVSGVSGEGYEGISEIGGTIYDKGINIFNGGFRGASSSSGDISGTGSVISSTSNSSSTGAKTSVIASSNSSASGEYGSVISSLGCSSTNKNNVVLGSSNSTASGNRSSVISSFGVESTGSYKVNGGFGEGTSRKNIKWELDGLNGKVIATGTFTGGHTFSDFGEYFESIDGEKIETGFLVTLDNGYIRKANINDDILGVISETAGIVLGEQTWEWQGKYERNEFGGLIYEDKLVKEVLDDGTVIKEVVNTPKVIKDYKEDKDYKSRSERDEWHIVGLVGQVYVRIDDTVKINEGISSNEGIATKGDYGKVMDITTPYDEDKGYGVAKVMIK